MRPLCQRLLRQASSTTDAQIERPYRNRRCVRPRKRLLRQAGSTTDALPLDTPERPYSV